MYDLTSDQEPQYWDYHWGGPPRRTTSWSSQVAEPGDSPQAWFSQFVHWSPEQSRGVKWVANQIFSTTFSTIFSWGFLQYIFLAYIVAPKQRPCRMERVILMKRIRKRIRHQWSLLWLNFNWQQLRGWRRPRKPRLKKLYIDSVSFT